MFIIIVACVLILIFLHTTCISKCKNTKYENMKSVGDVDFNDIYENAISYTNDIDGRTGIDKCYEKCSGNCVEYGVTGDSFCFPAE
jgi:hypothetical protein